MRLPALKMKAPLPTARIFYLKFSSRPPIFKTGGGQMESSLKRISLIIILYLSWLMIASSMK
jgi:hypothetical protein